MLVPSDVETLLTLPGIGAYTARAVACFAYRQRVPVVDTNVRRVVARAVHGRADAAASSSPRDLTDVERLLPNDADAPRFSAALMELGATVCTARAPKCGLCPLSVCVWRSRGYPAGTEARRVQKYAGTDRQVRGRLLDVLRGNDSPVTRAQLDVAWLTDTAQRDRALDSFWSTVWSSRPPTADSPLQARAADRKAFNFAGGASDSSSAAPVVARYAGNSNNGFRGEQLTICGDSLRLWRRLRGLATPGAATSTSPTRYSAKARSTCLCCPDRSSRSIRSTPSRRLYRFHRRLASFSPRDPVRPPGNGAVLACRA